MNTSEHVAALREQGYTVIEKLLIDNEINRLKSALEPWLNGQLMGRNNFEGEKSERVYALLAKHPDFALLVEHKKILAILVEMLEPDYLLSANLAINVHPGETPQPFHHDNNGGSFGVAGDTHLNTNPFHRVVGAVHNWAQETAEEADASRCRQPH